MNNAFFRTNHVNQRKREFGVMLYPELFIVCENPISLAEGSGLSHSETSVGLN